MEGEIGGIKPGDNGGYERGGRGGLVTVLEKTGQTETETEPQTGFGDIKERRKKND